MIWGYRMSQTYYIICKDCKKNIWAGQGSYDKKEKGHLYSDPEIFKFLIDHQNHNLIFVNAEHEDLDETEEIDCMEL